MGINSYGLKSKIFKSTWGERGGAYVMEGSWTLEKFSGTIEKLGRGYNDAGSGDHKGKNK